MGTATWTPSFSAQAVRLGLSQETVQPKTSKVRRKGDLGAAGAVQEGGAVVAGEADRGAVDGHPHRPPAPAGTAKRERIRGTATRREASLFPAMGNTSKNMVFFSVYHGQSAQVK